VLIEEWASLRERMENTFSSNMDGGCLLMGRRGMLYTRRITVAVCDVCVFYQDTSMAAAGGSASTADVPDDVANRMSLFYANPTPMLNTLSTATEKLLQEVKVTTVVAVMGH